MCLPYSEVLAIQVQHLAGGQQGEEAGNLYQYNHNSPSTVQPVFQGYTITTTGRIVGNWVTRKPGTMIPELGEENTERKYRNPVVGQ